MKRIVICCDGTWNDLEMRYITNVGRLAQALDHRTPEGIEQLLYYDSGVAAETEGVMKYLEGGFGIGLDRHIADAYRFLCFNYEEGDQVCIFGFSRGAYTARSLAGMIGRVGLVARTQLKQIPEAMARYRKNEDTEAFRAQYGRDISIALLGCWDTVGALGIPDKTPWLPFDEWSKKKYEFHDAELCRNVEVALHAVAIDDKRKEFDVTLMNKQPDAPANQKLVQVWFPGDHSCVGGGAWEKRGLSNAALRWMVEEAAKQGVKLAVDFNRLADKAVVDHGIYVSLSDRFFYSDIERTLEATWDTLHVSAKRRWKETPSYRPAQLKKKFGKKLSSYYDDSIRTPIGKAKRLEVGESAWVRILAEKQEDSSHIAAQTGDVYRITIPGTQVWKDGDLDPCDIRGWSLRQSNPAWSHGKPEDFTPAKRKLIKAFKKKCPIPQADFFELIAKVGDTAFQRLKIPNKTNENDEYVVPFQADADGDLRFAANDVASSWDIIDKYDNNKGWILFKIERLS